VRFCVLEREPQKTEKNRTKVARQQHRGVFHILLLNKKEAYHGESISGRLESAVRHATRVSFVMCFFVVLIFASLYLSFFLYLVRARAKTSFLLRCARKTMLNFFEKMID